MWACPGQCASAAVDVGAGRGRPVPAPAGPFCRDQREPAPAGLGRFQLRRPHGVRPGVRLRSSDTAMHGMHGCMKVHGHDSLRTAVLRLWSGSPRNRVEVLVKPTLSGLDRCLPPPRGCQDPVRWRVTPGSKCIWRVNSKHELPFMHPHACWPAHVWCLGIGGQRTRMLALPE